ncbi:hypothetical protein LPE509_00417 [Legionella pneumophila subsp. pneumophila LPE509]|nr:hypothetical protein LPE509_00417 [Legionella pneumophila subsp. pneumophila LPE509]
MLGHFFAPLKESCSIKVIEHNFKNKRNNYALLVNAVIAGTISCV